MVILYKPIRIYYVPHRSYQYQHTIAPVNKNVLDFGDNTESWSVIHDYERKGHLGTAQKYPLFALTDQLKSWGFNIAFLLSVNV